MCVSSSFFSFVFVLFFLCVWRVLGEGGRREREGTVCTFKSRPVCTFKARFECTHGVFQRVRPHTPTTPAPHTNHDTQPQPHTHDNDNDKDDDNQPAAQFASTWENSPGQVSVRIV